MSGKQTEPKIADRMGAFRVREWRGLWWIPDSPDAVHSGVLKEQADGGTTLELIGGFDTTIKTPLPGGGFTIEAGSQRLPMLLGQCGPTRITVIEVMFRSSRGDPWAPYEQTLAAGTGLVGVALSDAKDSIFHTAHLRLENLLPWLNQGGLELTRSADGRTSAAKVTRTTPVTATYSSWAITGSTASGGFLAKHLHEATSVEAEIAAFLSVHSVEPRPHRGFSQIAHALTDLLTLAADQPCGQLSLTLDYPLPATAPTVTAGLAYDGNAEVLASRIWQAKPAEPVTSQYLFTCRDLPLDVLIERWLPLRERAADACNILLGTLYARPAFTEIRLLSMGIAAEALHAALFPDQRGMPDGRFKALKAAALDGAPKADREWLHSRLRNEPSYKDRLLQLAELPDQTAVNSLIPDRSAWARDLKDARNGMAHRARPNVSYDTLFELAEVSRFLLYLVLMNELGLPGEVQQRALQQNQFLSIYRHEDT